MIDPNKLDRKRVDELMKITATPIGPNEWQYSSELEKTCALINRFAVYLLEEIDSELKDKEARANRIKKPTSPDPLTGRGRTNPYE